MSEKAGSDIERLWIWIMSSSIGFESIWKLNSRVVLCRIRTFPTLIIEIKWLGSGLPLILWFINHYLLLFTCKCMVIACGPSLTLHVEHSTRTPRASILILSSSPLLAITRDRFIKLNLKNQVSFYYIYKSFPSKMSILTNFYPVELY